MNAPAILSSHIHAVTVHADGALVQRRLDLAGITDRPAQLRVVGLPLVAAGRPVRARVRDGAAEVLSCRLVALPAAAEGGDDRVLEQAVEEANDAVEDARRRVAAALARLRALNVLEPPARPDGVKGQPPPASPAGARFDMLRFRDQQAERLGADLAAARAAEEKADERLAQAEAALRQASSARAARSGELRLAVELQVRWPESGVAGWIELDYIVPGARWAPSYVLRFDRELGNATVQLRGLIAQHSGEDWSGVRIACATAPLQGWCELPRLAGRRIGRAQPPPPSAWRPAPSGSEALFADYDLFAVQERSPDTSPPAEPEGSSIALGAAVAKDDREVCEERQVVAPMAKKKSSGPPPCPSPAMPPAMSRSAVSAPGSAFGGAAASRDEADVEATFDSDDAMAKEESAGCEPGADLLDFAALRLAAADGDDRGRPRPGGDFAGVPGWSRASAQARRRAEELAPPPPGHQPVSPARHAVRWEGGLPVDVPSDGAWHVVPLAEGAGAVRLSLVVVPRESRTAFRSAAVTNPFDRGLTAGPADIYVGADYLLAGRLPDIGPGAEADIGLGVDQSLAVARNATFAEETAGMLGGSLHLRHAVRIALHNKSSRPFTVEVRERLPQPDEQVEHCAVKELKVEPPWEDWRPDQGPLPGGRRWMLELAPGARRELAYEYRIEIPAKNELVGGNRREA